MESAVPQILILELFWMAVWQKNRDNQMDVYTYTYIPFITLLGLSAHDAAFIFFKDRGFIFKASMHLQYLFFNGQKLSQFGRTLLSLDTNLIIFDLQSINIRDKIFSSMMTAQCHQTA